MWFFEDAEVVSVGPYVSWENKWTKKARALVFLPRKGLRAQPRKKGPGLATWTAHTPPNPPKILELCHDAALKVRAEL